MSVQERVGQLFLVTFEGDSAELDSNIADLILNYQIGGVVLSAENDNIIDATQVAELTAQLQRIALRAPLIGVDEEDINAELIDLLAEPGIPTSLADCRPTRR